MHLTVKRLGKRTEYISLLAAHAYFLSQVGADVMHARPFGFIYVLDIVLASAATVMWTTALITRLGTCGLSRWWALGYGVLLFAGCLAAALRKPNPTELAIAVITWVVLQIPLLALQGKPKDITDN